MVLVNSAKPYQPDEDASEADKLDHDVLRMWSYIVLMTMMLIPEALTVIYSLYRIIMKAEKKADMSTYLWVRILSKYKSQRKTNLRITFTINCFGLMTVRQRSKRQMICLCTFPDWALHLILNAGNKLKFGRNSLR